MTQQILMLPDPVLVALADTDRIRHFFGVGSETLVQWHLRDGFPIMYTGEGRGRRGYVPVREARAFVKRMSGLT